MIETSKLENIISKCGIILEFRTLPDSTLGYYFFDGNYYMILIDDRIRNLEKLYRTVLAEEIGHYRTTIGDITPRKYMCYGDRLEVDKKEVAALRWAVDFLIPTEMLLDAIKNKFVRNLSEMADHFVVTEQFVMHKLEFMARKQSIWKIDDQKSLCLMNLPSVFIYQQTLISNM
ncbi:MAG: peptidase [Anaerosolibacter sp.]|uniref:ImmA/IrrE family metallo-endopeptidase n=1 Tax=Anaerosolibacter sp. TaxID=1872527 RepID=UPI002A4BDEC1|nr:peptidase [Anaerosolibacter sp.]